LSASCTREWISNGISEKQNNSFAVMRFTSPRVQPKFSHSEPFLSDESLLTPDKTQFAAGLSGEQAFRRTNDF